MAKVSPLSLPPDQALRFFRDKITEGSFDHRDIFGGLHATYFTVAKAMELDVLEAIRTAANDALAGGQTKERFAADLTPTLQKLGWWGAQVRVDPLDGQEKLVQLGSARRLATIYDTNLRTAYAAGRWERIQSRKDSRPWLRYVCVLDGRERPQHRAWHGTILRVDDPWWRTHYPPCGWFCRCSVQQLSDDDLTRLGLEPSARAPDLKNQPWTNPRTGATIQLPDGIDPGFGHNVGLAADQAARVRLIEKLDAADPALAAGAVSDGMKSAAFVDFLREGANRLGDWPVGVLAPGLAADAMALKARVVRLSRDSADKQARNHKDIGADDYQGLAAALRSDKTPLPANKPRHWALTGEHNGKIYKAIIKTARFGREAFLQSFHVIDAAELARIELRGWAAVDPGPEGVVM
jgi:SPP1 gp7 family putative phage head morphogenesis protein